MARTSRVEIPITAKDNATRQIQRVKSQLMGLASTAKTVMSGLSGLGGVAGVAGITMLARSAISAGSAITDMATATQTGIEELQVLTFAAREAGASNDQMANLLIRVQKSAADAKRGLSTTVDAFDKLGISVDRFIQLSPEKMIEEVGRAVVRSKGDTTAYGAALDLLGTRNAPKLMEVLQKLGTDGFDYMAERARNANQVMSVETPQALDAVADDIENFKNSMIIRFGEALVFWSDFVDSINNTKFNIPGLDKLLSPMGGGVRERISNLTSEQERIDLIIELMDQYESFQDLLELNAASKNELLTDEQLSKTKAAIVNLEFLINLANKAQATPIINQRTGALIGETNVLLQDMATTSFTLGSTFQAAFDPTPVVTFADTLRTWVPEGFETVKTASEKTKDEVTNNLFDMASAADVFATGLENGLVNAAAQGKSAFGDMAQFILAELQRMLIRAMLFQAFTGLGGALSKSMPNVGAGLTSFGQRFGNAPVSGGRAAGGPVMGGRSYMVGERGPEIVTMGANGFVTPNHKLGGPTFNVDMRGASLEAVQRLEQIVMQVNGSIEQRSVAAVQDRFSRAPSYMRR